MFKLHRTLHQAVIQQLKRKFPLHKYVYNEQKQYFNYFHKQFLQKVQQNAYQFYQKYNLTFLSVILGI